MVVERALMLWLRGISDERSRRSFSSIPCILLLGYGPTSSCLGEIIFTSPSLCGTSGKMFDPGLNLTDSQDCSGGFSGMRLVPNEWKLLRFNATTVEFPVCS